MSRGSAVSAATPRSTAAPSTRSTSSRRSRSRCSATTIRWTGSWTRWRAPPGPARSGTGRSGSPASSRSCGSGPARWGPTPCSVREPTPPAGAGEPLPRVGRLLEDLRALDRAYAMGHHGRWSAARRAEIVDGCLRDLFGATAPATGVALIALGGFGRRGLSPGSDVDLMILHDGPHPDEVAALAERLLYPLWDAGLRVGHAVRTPAECVDAARELHGASATLDGRLLAGDAALWERAFDGVLAPVRHDPRAFAARLAEDREARRERFGSVSSLLEPDVKEGVGGLRDVQALGWLRAAIGAPLDETGIIRAAERGAADDAEEFLTRVRSALHLETGRGLDRLVLEQQPPIAAGMGFVDEPGLPAIDGLMRSVFEHARQVEHVVSSAFDRYLRGSSPLPQV